MDRTSRVPWRSQQWIAGTLKLNVIALCMILCGGVAVAADLRNLLVNRELEFHSFINHRSGQADSFSANHTAGWSTDGPKDITVVHARCGRWACPARTHDQAGLQNACFAATPPRARPSGFSLPSNPFR